MEPKPSKVIALAEELLGEIRTSWLSPLELRVVDATLKIIQEQLDIQMYPNKRPLPTDRVIK